MSNPATDGASFDGARFRQVLGHFPTGVTVVTTSSSRGPAGLTIGSFSSISLEPPLVGFFPGVTSDTWPAIEESGSFCVNVLGADQGELCWRFAKDIDGDRFADVPWQPAPTGSPILGGAVAWIDCTVADVHTIGDHLLVVGAVQALDVAAAESPDPMLFFRGKLGRFELA